MNSQAFIRIIQWHRKYFIYCSRGELFVIHTLKRISVALGAPSYKVTIPISLPQNYGQYVALRLCSPEAAAISIA